MSLIIDNDGGLDDAMATLMVLKALHPARPPTGPLVSPLYTAGVKLVAITTVSGNVAAPQATENCRMIIRMFGGGVNVPVYQGCTQPIIGPLPPSWEGHGPNGLGGASFPEGWDDFTSPSPPLPELTLATNNTATTTTDKPSSEQKSAPSSSTSQAPVKSSDPGEHAVLAMIRILSAAEDKSVYITALGPLTNVAMLVRLRPDLLSKIKLLHVMGGSLTGRGNTSFAAEFNFLCDPEAAQIVLSSFTADQLVMVTWELTEKYGFTQEQYDELSSKRSRESRFMKQICRMYEDVEAKNAHHPAPEGPTSLHVKERIRDDPCGHCHRDHPSAGFSVINCAPVVLPGQPHGAAFIICDAISMSTFLYPQIVRTSRDIKCCVELGGTHSRGFLAVDWMCRKRELMNVCAVESLDEEQLFQVWSNLVSP